MPVETHEHEFQRRIPRRGVAQSLHCRVDGCDERNPFFDVSGWDGPYEATAGNEVQRWLKNSNAEGVTMVSMARESYDNKKKINGETRGKTFTL